MIYCTMIAHIVHLVISNNVVLLDLAEKANTFFLKILEALFLPSFLPCPDATLAVVVFITLVVAITFTVTCNSGSISCSISTVFIIG